MDSLAASFPLEELVQTLVSSIDFQNQNLASLRLLAYIMAFYFFKGERVKNHLDRMTDMHIRTTI